MKKLVLLALVHAGGVGAQTNDELLRNNFLNFTAPSGEVISQYEFETGDACYKFLASKGPSVEVAGSQVLLTCGEYDHGKTLPYAVHFASSVSGIVGVQYAYPKACRDFVNSIPVATPDTPTLAPKYTATCS